MVGEILCPGSQVRQGIMAEEHGSEGDLLHSW